MTIRLNTIHTTKTGRIAAATTLTASALVMLAGCAGGSMEGTYYGTSEHTALLIQGDGACLYTEYYEEGEELVLDEMDGCTWTSSGTDLTFSGISSGGTVVGTLSDDGSISLPDQNRWNGEIYSKR